MKHQQEVKGTRQTFNEVIDVTCDGCGKSTRDSMDMNFEYAELSATWGFCSNKDCEQHSCQLCETCYDKVRAFIHSIGGSVNVKNYSPGLGGAVSVPDYE